MISATHAIKYHLKLNRLFAKRKRLEGELVTAYIVDEEGYDIIMYAQAANETRSDNFQFPHAT